MQPNRRHFLKHLGWLAAAKAGLGSRRKATASEDGHVKVSPRAMGVLVDLTLCVGCRLCEHACKQANGFDPGPVESYDDQSVFRQMRRPAPDAYTMVNAWPNPRDRTKPVYVKTNCFHCNHPACVSACIVGALQKQETGPVTYDAWKCIGCRYCMVACPFQIPAYDYDDAFAPQVRKCQLCFERTEQEGTAPACVTECPRQTMVYGRRSELLELAREKIETQPDKYVEHIYGEHEVGGTSWLYLSGVPFQRIGFLELPDAAPPVVTESIQHGVFKYGLPPLALYGILGGIMYLTRPDRSQGHDEGTEDISERRDHTERADRGPSLHTHAMALAGVADGSIILDESQALEVPQAEYDMVQPANPAVPNHDHAVSAHEHHEIPMPVDRRFLTPGVFVLLGLVATGLAFGLYRFIFGIGSMTNLDNQYPWGLWIGIDVASGVALAAGGFTSAFLTHVLHREKYHAIARPALLTAMLGYTFVVIGLLADLGRYYNVWHPMIMWQGNSVLFEVGLCVMCYLTVLYMEFAPIACERLMAFRDRFPRLGHVAEYVYGRLDKIMFLLVIAGCVLSCLHQSSLGNLMVIAPSKLHPLWWTPLSPLLFLLSAIAVGFPMVIWESLVAGWSLKLKPEMDVLGPLARFVPFTLGLYLAVKIGDMIWRGTYIYLGDASLQSACWLVEVLGGVVIPMLMLLNERVRRSPRLLWAASTLVVLGVVFNRVNVFLIGYRPPYATQAYVPSIGEFAVTIGLISALMLIYRIIVTWLPVISQPDPEATE